MSTTKKKPKPVPKVSDQPTCKTPAADVDSATPELIRMRARQREQFVSWWARIMTEIEVVRDSLQSGSVSRWDGILTGDEQLTLDIKLDHVWGMMANAIPKAVPAELADVIADVKRRDQVT